MCDLFKKFRKDEDGATLVEYAVVLLIVIIAGGAVWTELGSEAANNIQIAGDVDAFDNALAGGSQRTFTDAGN